MTVKEIQKKLKTRLKPARYEHTLGVASTARHLAQTYDYDEAIAELAGLLHDCAKYMDDDKKIALCKEYDVPISDAEYKNPSLLHAKCGAILAANEYQVTNPDILHAIRVHTTGVPDMNLLDKILFISDYIEPNRDKAPHLKELRKIAEQNLDLTTYHILKDTVEYLKKHEDQTMDPTTLAAYDYYKNWFENQNTNQKGIGE